MAAAFGKTALVTGATGLVGREALARLLQDRPSLTVYALVRSRERFAGLAAELGPLAVNVTPVRGDVTAPGLGLSRAARSLLRNRVTTVLHLAADTTFSRPLEEARRVNTEGTARVLELAAECVSKPRVLFVSTAFVAGRRTGRVPEAENGAEPGFVNAYEQSKYEAEQLVRACGLPWLILRPSMIVCDARTGVVRQFNAVHRALRLYYHGLASLMPGDESWPVDAVPSDYVGGAVARLVLAEEVDGVVHLCAGVRGALPLGEMLDITYGLWARAPEWRRRGIARPVLTDLETYRLFERSIEETGDTLLIRASRSLSHFIPQLAYPKQFETDRAEALLGGPAPPVRSYWPRMVQHLMATDWWACGVNGAAAA